MYTKLLARTLLIGLAALGSSACAPLGVGKSDQHSPAPQGRWVNPDAATVVRTHKTPDYRSVSTDDLVAKIQPAIYNAPQVSTVPNWATNRPPLSPGDRVMVKVSDGDEFSGTFELDLDGTLNLPFLPPLQLAGRQTRWAEQKIAEALVNGGYFREGLVQVTLRIQQWAPVQISVSGAVFVPGLVTVNVRKPEEKALKSTQVSGDFPPDRLMPAALRAAGGVRPDADLSRVVLVRNGETTEINLAGLVHGLPAPSIPLMAGDALIVPSTGQYDELLARPTAVTPPGIRVFLSNLTVPSLDNSKSAISDHSTSLPYGTRMLTALISANCVGGTASTNSARYGVLVTFNPISGESEVIERSIEDMLRDPQRADLNPMVMPNDGLACYDSGVTNVRDIARSIADIVLPLKILR